ncbi:MAG TPA: helix-turn-helix domain-containing protein [Actinomycetales bacterium]|nr:helix-turn-helix domain-containing protein [Actinomycetales bacterium]
MATSTSDFSSEPGSAETLRRLRNSSGMLATAAVRRLDEELTWFKELEAENRSWVGLVAQAGISAFISWFENPTSPGQATDQIFAAAPPELTRSISLQNTLQLVRVVVEVVEEHTDQLAAPGNKAQLREAVLRYSREVAFSAAEVYARAAEVRGAWDARLEALVVDAIIRGDTQESLGSRMSALGWSGHGGTVVVIGHTPRDVDGPYTTSLRRAARRAAADALVGIQGDRLVLVLGGTGDLRAAATSLADHFGPGPIVLGPQVASLAEAGASARHALTGLKCAAAWPTAPRPVSAGELLPERALINDPAAQHMLIADIYHPLAQSRGSLLETLESYIDSGRSLEATARGLYVHPNTVRYRLRKVAELCGWDALEPREAYVLQVALALGRLHKTRWGRDLGHVSAAEPPTFVGNL